MTLQPVRGRDVALTGGFWDAWQRRLRTVTLPYQWRVLTDREPGIEPPSHAVRNLARAAGEAPDGGPLDSLGRYPTDSDIAKWLEGAAYVCERGSDPQLEAWSRRIVALVARAQWADGYLGSRQTIERGRPRYARLRRDHELYIAGHWLEALVARVEGLGDEQARDVALRLGDHLVASFGPGSERPHAVPDHPEVELALVRLWRTTGRGAYLDLAEHFVEERGRTRLFTAEAERDGEAYDETYSITDQPLAQQPAVSGHAVRALYLYAGATALAGLGRGNGLGAAVRRLWWDVTHHQMYVTGAVGADGEGERLTLAYDLPSDRAYAETCAAVALVLWAREMLCLGADGTVADVLERALYNAVLPGVSLDGTRYFYVTPLAVWPAQARVRHDLRDVAVARQPWFACACCPPNAARLIAQVPDLLYAVGRDEAVLYVHQFAASTARAHLADGQEVRIRQEGDYPWSGDVSFTVEEAAPPGRWTLALRRPGFARSVALLVNGRPADTAPAADGYMRLDRVWLAGDEVRLVLDMPITRVRAHPLAWELGGAACLMRGPLVYCFEEVDNGPGLAALSLPPGAKWRATPADPSWPGAQVLRGRLQRRVAAREDLLYAVEPWPVEYLTATAVPYAYWGNRGPGEMRVWLPET